MPDEDDGLSTFEKKVAARRAKEQAAASLGLKFDEDLIPDTDTGNERPRDHTLDALIKDINIVDAYDKWYPSTRVKGRRVGESIKMSCPIDGHEDRHASAWMDSRSGLWNCSACGLGGDIYTMAAHRFGVQNYQSGAHFHEVRKHIAESFGYTIQQAPPGEKPVVVAPLRQEELPTELPESASTIADIREIDVTNTLDWRSIVGTTTFLAEYMKCVEPDDTPEEYNFWNAMLAISLSVGRDVVLMDRRPVLGNLYICLLGPTGDGKSRSFSHLRDLLNEAVPYDPTNANDRGTKIISGVGSGEALIQYFDKPLPHPLNPAIIEHHPVRGLIHFDEMSGLISRCKRPTSIMRPVLMEFYDGNKLIESGALTSGIKRAVKPFACLLTTTQPKALNNLLEQNDADSGFLNRWVFVSATPKKQIAIGGYEVDITPALMPLHDIRAWSRTSVPDGRIQWSAAAYDRFTEFFENTLLPVKQKDDTDLVNRIDLLCKKLILLLCINEKQPEVPLSIVEKVISMMPYITKSYGIAGDQMASNEESKLMDTVLSKVKQYHTKGGIAARDLCKLLPKGTNRKLVDYILEHLEKRQYIVKRKLDRKPGARGPMKEIFLLGD